MNVLLVCGYSARNAGDGLLVDLARTTIEQAVRPAINRPISIKLVAADPSSFQRYEAIAAPAALGASFISRVCEALVSVATRQPPSRVRQAIAWADVVIAVGGGYLRFGTPAEAFKARAVHLSQIAHAVRTGKPVVLFPQSIGPFGVPWGVGVRRTLSHCDTVFVRDDRSLCELGARVNTERVPDMAVAAVAARSTSAQRERGDLALVARGLPRARGYETRLLGLYTNMGHARVLVQSATGSRNDDARWLTSLGLSVSGSLSDALAERVLSVTVSVRLHGSVQSILAGVPSVHLSYERKGFSAYRDLGLEEWVHNARNFDPGLVADQTHRLAEDPTEYWRRLEVAKRRMSDREVSGLLARRITDSFEARPRRTLGGN